MYKVGKIRDAPNDPQTELEHVTVKGSLYTLNNYPEAQVLVHFALRSVVFKIPGHRNSEIHQITPNWTWTLNSQNYSIYIEYLLQRPKFWSISLYNKPFQRYKVKNRKYTEWPQTEFEHITVKSTLYILNTYPWCPNFGPFHSMTSSFQDTIKVTENRKCTEWPQTELGHLTVKTTLYTLNIYSRGPNFGPLRSTTSCIPDWGHKKLEMHRMTRNWTWTLNSQKYILYK